MIRAVAIVLLLVCAAAVKAQRARGGTRLWPSASGAIAFRSDQDVKPDVLTIGTPGTGPRNLTDDLDAAAMQPAWSPDGERIAFVRGSGAAGRPDLFVMTGRGTGRTRLTTTIVPERDPAWSPDGSRIAYAVRKSVRGPFRISVVKADGTGRERLTTQAEGSADRAPAWSPDGTRIAFMSDRDGGFPEIYLMNMDGTGLTRLTTNTYIDGNPSWSPDGTRIVVERCCPNGSSEDPTYFAFNPLLFRVNAALVRALPEGMAEHLVGGAVKD